MSQVGCGPTNSDIPMILSTFTCKSLHIECNTAIQILSAAVAVISYIVCLTGMEWKHHMSGVDPTKDIYQ